jgi:hypothetical protein
METIAVFQCHLFVTNWGALPYMHVSNIIAVFSLVTEEKHEIIIQIRKSVGYNVQIILRICFMYTFIIVIIINMKSS